MWEGALKMDQKITVLGDGEKYLQIKQKLEMGQIDEDLEVVYQTYSLDLDEGCLPVRRTAWSCLCC